MLRNVRDCQSVLYLLAQPALAFWQWRNGVSWPLYATMLFLSIGVSSIHHNHAHLKMWHHRSMNRLTDFWLTLLQGHPTFVFHAAHNANHHRFHHGPLDVTRTYRFGGDTNHLLGYLLHPFQATWALLPLFTEWLSRLRRNSPSVFRYCLSQYLAVIVLWGSMAAIDWQKWLVILLIPQSFGLHWLLAANYLQHAHADGQSDLNFARNFEGLLNLLLFNTGMHTAHHLHGRVHWSELPGLHHEYRSRIHPQLNAGRFLPYIMKTFVLSLFWYRFRSQSMMALPNDGGVANRSNQRSSN